MENTNQSQLQAIATKRSWVSLVIAVAVIAVLTAGYFVFFPPKATAPQTSTGGNSAHVTNSNATSTPSGIGGEIYTKGTHPAAPNPIDSIYKNPFQ